ncbi:hypothetical protein CBR_g51286 [Chara braunii]|uniref:Myb-like domain-containing protein n=1 Tax=Chara braunii TaxID=69332 RepID=A0A388M8I7_CHABU|nr:hypothetical protein CBR_g51286 [Chara braunii]|eukprot:GBG90779.1 hypothetical protein CBR_g51286 [Chara braunii]
MADLCRRLPLLLLAVVVFHICILGRVPGRKQRRRTTKATGKMEKVQTKRTMSIGAGGSSRQHCNSAEGGRHPYDPTLYSHLPSHEIPLPPSDDDSDEPRSSTVPLGSGSTQDWMGSQLYRQPSTPTYTDLLEGRTPVGYDGGLVDLNLGLRSGIGQDVTHTFLVNPGSGGNHTAPSVGPCGLPDTRGRGSGQSGDERGVDPRGRAAVGTTGVHASGTRTGGSTTAGGAVHQGRDDADGYAAEVVGREVWDDYRRQSRQSTTSAITRGVAKVNVGADDTPGDCDGAGGEDCSAGDGGNDNDDDDDGEMEIRPLGKKRGGPRATSKSSEPRAGRRGKKTAGDASAGDRAKSRDFWTVEHMIALVRAKRDQDLHLAGLGHNMGRMKTKTWKWADIESRLVQMGVTTRKADDWGKKWDNLYMQFKIVHKFMGESGKPDFFTLSLRKRKEWGFDFRMDERVYSEMMAMYRGDHTLHPTNLVDTGAAGGVQVLGRPGGRKDSGGSDGCGDGQDDDQGSIRDRRGIQVSAAVVWAGAAKGRILPARRSGDGGRARYFSGAAIGFRAGCGDEEQLSAIKQSIAVGAAGASLRTPKAVGVVITKVHLPRQLPAATGQGHPRQALPLQQLGASGGGKAEPAQKGDATAIDTRTAAADHSGRTGVAEGAGEERVDDGRHDEGRRDGKREGNNDDDRPLGPGKTLREAVGECADYFIAIANGDTGAEPPAMLILPLNDMPRFKIEDPAQREPALRRARNVEKLVLRAIHGWIFKSLSRSAGFARAESYISVDVATDVARAVWQGQEWSNVVSPALVYHTLALKMDVPLWFAGVKIVDRPEDDDMAAWREATILRIVECWTNALWCGQWANGGRVKEERFSLLADCLRALLSACMWIMRMGGHDDRSHYEACLYSSMVAKPTMIAAGSYIFNWRQHFVDSSNLVLDRIGKAHLTLGEYPHCIPEWCDCGSVFGHNAARKNAAETAKHGWIGSGPAAEEVGDEDVDTWVRPWRSVRVRIVDSSV